MATTENATYRCMRATSEELDDMLASADYAFHDYLQAVNFHEIDWSTVHHLRIMPENNRSVIRLRNMGIFSNFFLCHDGLIKDKNWLLVIPPDNISPEKYLNHCPPCLQTLWVKDSPQLSKFPKLEKLTQLTKLKLVGCENLAELPGLENLIKLTELDFRGCRRIAELRLRQHSNHRIPYLRTDSQTGRDSSLLTKTSLNLP